MKVLFLLTSLGAGGTERSTALLMPALRDRGVDCEIAVLKRVELGDEQTVLAQGFVIHEVSGRTVLNKVWALRSLLGRIEPDIVHTALFDADIVGRLAGWRMSPRVVSSLVNTSYDPVRIRDSNVRRWKLAVARFADGWTARHLTDQLHAVSEGVASANSRHLRIPLKKIRVIERGRDSASMQPAGPEARVRVRGELGISADTPVVLAVGRIEYQKGHVTLLEAAARLQAGATGPHPVVLIAGRAGNASADVTDRIQELGLGDTVRLLGHRTDVPDLLAAADVFVLPSRYEGTAGVVIEAMAARVPIVSSDVAGLVGVLEQHMSATLVPIDDPVALTDAIARVMAGGPEVEAMVGYARSQFDERFTLERSADRMVSFYESVAGRSYSGTGC